MKNYKELKKDICARMPFGVKVAIYGSGAMELSSINKCDLGWYAMIDGAPTDFGIDEIKPYLRPMSELKDEELLQFGIAKKCFDDVRGMKGEYYVPSDKVIDWVDYLNSHFYDYRELIEQHLAIQAPEGMYN